MFVDTRIDMRADICAGFVPSGPIQAITNMSHDCAGHNLRPSCESFSRRNDTSDVIATLPPELASSPRRLTIMRGVQSCERSTRRQTACLRIDPLATGVITNML